MQIHHGEREKALLHNHRYNWRQHSMYTDHLPCAYCTVCVWLDRRSWRMCGKVVFMCGCAWMGVGRWCVCASVPCTPMKRVCPSCEADRDEIESFTLVPSECLNRVICFALSFSLLNSTPNKGLLSAFNWNAGLCKRRRIHMHTHMNVFQHRKSMQQTFGTHAHTFNEVSHMHK